MSCTDKMYLTGNEICSDNSRDLSDNARVFDAYVNSAEFSVTDRFGIERVTLAWAKWRVDNAIDEATGEIRAEWQTGVANINNEETNALNNINTTTTASLSSIEEAKDNAIEEIIETGGTTIVQEPGQDINKVMSQKAVTDFVTEEIDNIVFPEPVNVVNEPGDSTTDAISQKTFTNMSFGIGQSYKNLAANRVAGVTYTNEEVYSIDISVTRSISGSSYSNQLYIDNILVSASTQGGSSGSRAGSVNGTVHPGSKYRFEGTFDVWSEARKG